MTAVYTWDVFSTLDGYGSYTEGADWGGYWSRQGPELLEHRAALFDTEQQMVFGATTFREIAQMMSWGIDSNTLDEWNVRSMRMPATVVSSTLQDTLSWPDATIVSGNAVDIVARLKEESDVPLRSQASLSLNWALMAAGVTHAFGRRSRRLPGGGSGPPRRPEPRGLLRCTRREDVGTLGTGLPSTVNLAAAFAVIGTCDSTNQWHNQTPHRGRPPLLLNRSRFRDRRVSCSGNIGSTR